MSHHRSSYGQQRPKFPAMVDSDVPKLVEALQTSHHEMLSRRG